METIRFNLYLLMMSAITTKLTQKNQENIDKNFVRIFTTEMRRASRKILPELEKAKTKSKKFKMNLFEIAV